MNPCNNRFPLRPAAREEAGLFYSDDQADRTLGLDRPVGRVSFANGERMEFTAPQDYLRTIREELHTRDVPGFRFEPLTDAPAVRKAYYADFQQALAADPAYAFICYIDANYVAKSNIKGIDTDTVLGHHGVGIFWNIQNWEIA